MENNIKLSMAEKNVINAVRVYKLSQKTQIAEKTKIPWGTALKAIDNLCSMGILRDILDESKNAKRTKLTINEKRAYFLGASIGRSHIKIALVDFGLELIKFDKQGNCDLLDGKLNNIFNKFGLKFSRTDNSTIWCIKTPRDSETALTKIKDLINSICGFAVQLKEAGLEVVSLCFAFPGHVDADSNLIIKSDFIGFNLSNVSINSLIKSEMLQNLEDKHILINLEHNVKAAAVAEKEKDEQQNNFKDANMLIFYLGSGLGSAFILNNKLYRGHSNGAGNVGATKNIDLFGDTNSRTTKEVKILNDKSLERILNEDIFPETNEDECVLNCMGDQLAAILNKYPERKKLFVKCISRVVLNVATLLELDVVQFSGKLSSIYQSIESEFQEIMILNEYSNIKAFASMHKEFSSAIGSAICAYYRYLELSFDWDY